MVKSKKYLKKKNKKITRRGGFMLNYIGLTKRKPNKQSPIIIIDNDFSFVPITPNDLSMPRYSVNMNVGLISKLYLKDSICKTVTKLKNSKNKWLTYHDILLTNQDESIFMSGNFNIGNKTFQGKWEIEEIFPITLSLLEEDRPLKFCDTQTEYDINKEILKKTLYGPDTLYNKNEYKFENVDKYDPETLPNVRHNDLLYRAIQLLYRFLKSKYDLYEENTFVYPNTSFENFSEEDIFVRIDYNESDIIEFILEPNMEESVLTCCYIHNGVVFDIIAI